MRHLFGLFLLVACAARPPQRIPPPAAGALALVEAARDLAGHPIGASPAASTIVVFLASWCEHCAAELEALASVRAKHPEVRIVGVSYAAHENYDHRGNPAALARYGAAHPWLPIAIADEALFAALGAPPMIPTVFVFDRAGTLVAQFDRRVHAEPTRAELETALGQAARRR